MAIRIYNTLTKKKERFEPLEKDKVGIYVCGPTVYDSCHIGHARSVVVFDVVVRYFRACNFKVNYVRNFTDVDDKIINRSNELRVDTTSLSEKYIDEFYTDMDALKVKRADHEPKVTDHIKDIITIVEKLMNNSAAYEAGGDVYFSVEKFKEYGKLSGRSLGEMVAGSRVKINEQKHNPADFVLWKGAKPDEPWWESPWGKGRPGWHIECSAMSCRFLSETFDIHGGGKDLIFPHHENEIAQSEAAHGKTFARYWMHNGFVNINNEKMSKSLNNFLMIKDILKSHHPEAVRLFLLSNHYRSPIDFTDKNLEEAQKGLDKIYTALGRLETLSFFEKKDTPEESGAFWDMFCDAMDDDFNTARGIGILFNAVKEVNRILDKEPDGAGMDSALALICNDMRKMGSILGILTTSSETYFSDKKQAAVTSEAVDPEQIEKLIEERVAARKDKNWSRADEIRSQLEKMNVVLEDRQDGTIWKIEK